MKKTMKAWITYDFGDMRLEEVDIPKPNPGWALIRLESFQPSITEVERFKGVNIEGTAIVKNTLQNIGPTSLFGHEFSGRIVEINGHKNKILKVGQRVSLNYTKSSCGNCDKCLIGIHTECQDMQYIGLDYAGCFAEYCIAPQEILNPVPEELSIAETVCLQPLSSVIGNIDNAKIEIGDIVAVLGLGVMGNYVAQVARVAGAKKVIASDIRENNIDLAKKLGIDIVVNVKKDNIEDLICKETCGKGADIVFECAGGRVEQGLSGGKTLEQAVNIVRKGGKISQIAHIEADNTIPFKFTILRNKNITYLGDKPATDKHFYYGIDLILSKRITVKELITHSFEGIEYLPDSFEITGNKEKYKSINPAQVVI